MSDRDSGTEYLYMVVVTIGDYDKEEAPERSAKIAPKIYEVLKGISGTTGQLAFTGYKGTFFGYMLKTRKSGGTILGLLRDETEMSNLHDSAYVVEINGGVFGSNKINLWLDKHW